jgi:succinoglycan biosynthesis transport protein ExoP
VDTLEENFRFLRVRVQHEVALPAFVVVGAALRGDGTTYVACGLARAFAEAGHHTLLLDANPRNSGIADELGMVRISGAAKPDLIDRNLSVAALYDREDEERVVADDELDEVVARVRARYAVTIVDAPAIPGSGGALQLARVADGLLVAVRLGRRPRAEDHEMKMLLGADGLLGGKAVCGIVPTRPVKRRSPRSRAAAVPVPSLSDVIGGFVPRVQTTR